MPSFLTEFELGIGVGTGILIGIRRPGCARVTRNVYVPWNLRTAAPDSWNVGDALESVSELFPRSNSDTGRMSLQ
jgi:hypothetical protein